MENVWNFPTSAAVEINETQRTIYLYDKSVDDFDDKYWK